MSDKIDMNKQNNTKQSKIIDNTNEVLENQSIPEYKKIENNKVPTSPTTKEMNRLRENKQDDINEFDYSKAYANASEALGEYEYIRNKEFDNLNPSNKNGFNKRLDDAKKELTETPLQDKINKTREILGNYSRYEPILRLIENRIATGVSNNDDDAIVTRMYGLAKIDTSHREKKKSEEEIPETTEEDKDKDKNKAELNIPRLNETGFEKVSEDNLSQGYKEKTRKWLDYISGKDIEPEFDKAFNIFYNTSKKWRGTRGKLREKGEGISRFGADENIASYRKRIYDERELEREKIKNRKELIERLQNIDKLQEEKNKIQESIKKQEIKHGYVVDRRNYRLWNERLNEIDKELNSDDNKKIIEDLGGKELKIAIQDNLDENSKAQETLDKIENMYKDNDKKIKLAIMSASQYQVDKLVKDGIISSENGEELKALMTRYKDEKRPENLKAMKIAFLVVDAVRKTILNIARAMPRTQYSADLGEMETPAIDNIISTAISNTQDAIHQSQTGAIETHYDAIKKQIDMDAEYWKNWFAADKERLTNVWQNTLLNNTKFRDLVEHEFKGKLPHQIMSELGNMFSEMTQDELVNYIKGMFGENAKEIINNGLLKLIIEKHTGLPYEAFLNIFSGGNWNSMKNGEQNE
ncbi:hypothetical protein [Methanobrevibacter sp.]|uniref:hypothetical protein n=1 Tax=Methanobrevibacter sp. TaxID=66852 RepID=UPI00388D9AA6